MSEIKRKKKIIGSRSVLDEELKYTLCPFLFILHIHQTRGEEEEEKRKKKKELFLSLTDYPFLLVRDAFFLLLF